MTTAETHSETGPARSAARSLGLRLGVLLIAAAFLACSSKRLDPLQDLQQMFAAYPDYSIVLDDMMESGNFRTEYWHKYKVIYGETKPGQEDVTFRNRQFDWMEVDERTYKRYGDFLGMTVAAKKDGEVQGGEQPAGYQYVGNSRYGQWQTNSSGASFWVFYGQYALLRDAFGTFSRPVYRQDYDDYQRRWRPGGSYYGRGNEFGTRGSLTRETRKSFYDRQRARQMTAKDRFSNKVNQRAQRSRSSGLRSRGGRGGK